MTRTAEDAALMLQVMSGVDPMDSTSADIEVPDFRSQLGDSIAGLRIGIPRQYFSADLDPRVHNRFTPHCRNFSERARSWWILSCPIPTGVSPPTTSAPAEASANLSRYDGVRFGHRCDAPADLQDLYERSRTEGFGDEVKRRILVGTYALSAGFYDAYFKKAQQVRRLISQISARHSDPVMSSPDLQHPGRLRPGHKNQRSPGHVS